MELLLGFGAGLLTLLNPCVLPVLPIALASALQGDRRGPLMLALGMSITFVILGVTLAAIGPAMGIREEQISKIGAAMMIGFGIILLVPKLSTRFASATAGIASSADMKIGTMDPSSLRNQFFGGVLLGAVWSPCVGPTLGGAISLASQGGSLWWAGAIMTSYAAGISTIILALAYGASETIRSRQANFRAIAEKAKPIMGITFLLVGIMIYFKFHQYLEGLILNSMPYWLQDLSVLI